MRSFSWLCALLGAFLLSPPLAGATTITDNISNIVYIACGDIVDDEVVTYAYGSGIVFDDTTVLTNAHVSNFESETEGLITYDWCLGGVAENGFTAPEFTFGLEYTDIWGFDEYFDYEFLTAFNVDTGEPWSFTSTVTYGNPDSLVHGDDIMLLGYPGVAGETITSTQGQVSGFNGTNWIKTDAVADFGSSGGGAFDVNGDVIGLTTAVATGELNSFTYVQNLNAILEDAFGTDFIIRDRDTMYTTDNVTCFASGDCFQFGESEPLELEGAVEAEEVETRDEERVSPPSIPGGTVAPYDESKRDDSLIARLAGNILLQVESAGEAWYLHPEQLERYYMSNGEAAYFMMRTFGLGITDLNLEQIPEVETPAEMLEATSVCQSNALARGLRGKILLQVEQRGEAYYVHPDTCQMIYMADGDAAYDIMRFLSLGITNEDLTKIPSAIFN